MTRRTLASLAIVAAALLSSPPALAVGSSIANDTFVVDVVIDDGSGGTTTAGPFSAIAKAVDDNYFSDADMIENFDAGGIGYDIRVNWLDADSFDLFINAFGAIDLSQLSITLSDLDFAAAGVPAPIVGAAFNRAASNVDEFQAGSGMPNPSVSFTGRSVTADFSFFPLELVADGPRLRFDVQAPADSDGDGVADDADTCPSFANADQVDTGGLGSGSAPDGIGDACQCGDVSGDGRITLVDAVILQRSLLQPPAATLTRPELCDVGGGGAECTLADAVILRRALLQPPTTAIGQVCAPATP